MSRFALHTTRLRTGRACRRRVKAWPAFRVRRTRGLRCGTLRERPGTTRRARFRIRAQKESGIALQALALAVRRARHA